jgi:hypothetical protein
MNVPPVIAALALLVAASACPAADLPAAQREFLQENCVGCHDATAHKGGLDLTALKFDTDDPVNFARWVGIHDRVRDGEMPPKSAGPLDPEEKKTFLAALADHLAAADHARDRALGRSVWRRLNRYEYENTVRVLLSAPWLQLRDRLPEDGEAHRFNKSGSALDISHVQMARYLGAAEYALMEVTVARAERPVTKTTRYYAREQRGLTRLMKFGPFNNRPERGTFPLLGHEAQPDVLDEKSPVTVGASDPETRELEAFGVVAGSYEPIEPKFDRFRAPSAGRYKLRFSAYSFWAGPGKGAKWFIPDRYVASKGRTIEPMVIMSELPPRQLRTLGGFDVGPEPSVHELDVWLLEGERIGFDAARLFRSRPPSWHNPLATPEGCPGLAVRWMEVEGPIHDRWPPAGHTCFSVTCPSHPARTARRPLPRRVPRRTPSGCSGRSSARRIAGPCPSRRRSGSCPSSGRSWPWGPRSPTPCTPGTRPCSARPSSSAWPSRPVGWTIMPWPAGSRTSCGIRPPTTSCAGWPTAASCRPRASYAGRSGACWTTPGPGGSWTPSWTTGSTCARSA